MDAELKELCAQLHDKLCTEHATLSTAESCTAGGVASAITSVSGSSTYFKGGFVVYCNEWKHRFLGLSLQELNAKGAVRKEVAEQMLCGLLRAVQTTYGVAITGYTGPGGGPEAPVGTIWICAGTKERYVTCCLHENDGREANTLSAIKKAIKLLLTVVK